MNPEIKELVEFLEEEGLKYRIKSINNASYGYHKNDEWSEFIICFK
ncbi:MAG: hypothetical protein Satyrvirus15_17 [Satyrvirus sp.]|uniref:Uncharacterized protein n=1 Tax=Satyrvirus sp. TaxID=2487771 RepID=A0A3G5AE16_9VIRU|nr:MAG: hypothetical protein Satyrvirus15_17 [Satyrvirus sp.]